MATRVLPKYEKILLFAKVLGPDLGTCTPYYLIIPIVFFGKHSNTLCGINIDFAPFRLKQIKNMATFINQSNNHGSPYAFRLCGIMQILGGKCAGFWNGYIKMFLRAIILQKTIKFLETSIFGQRIINLFYRGTIGFHKVFQLSLRNSFNLDTTCEQEC